VNTLYLVASLVSNSLEASKKGSVSFRATVNALLARIKEFHTLINEANVNVEAVIPDGQEVANVNLGHAMLVYAASGNAKLDIRKEMDNPARMKVALGNMEAVQAAKVAYASERLEIRRAIAAVAQIDMVSSISKYRTLRAVGEKSNRDWGTVLTKNYSFFL